MENSKKNEKKKIYIAPIVNLNSKTSRKEPQDKINCLSFDLERMRSQNQKLPSISPSRKNLINQITLKLRTIKQKIKQNALQQTLSRQHNLTYQQPPNILPIPINYQIPYQIPYPMYCGPTCHQCQNCWKKKPNKQRRNKKQKKQPQKKQIKVKKKNKFRICGYAIYFTIFLKHYAQRFTINRRNWTLDRYHNTVKTIIDRGAEKFQQKIMELDLYQISKQSKENKRIGGTTNVDWQDITKTALIPLGIDPDRASQNRYTVGQFIINFTQNFMQKLKEIIFDEQFLGEYHEVFAAGSMDQNFMINNLYLPEQIPFLFVHPIKGYVRLGYQEEIQLLMMKLMIRMVIFNYLLSLHRFKDWNKRLQEKYRFQLSQREEVWQLGRVLGVFLYMATKQLYMEGIKNLKHVTNFYELGKKFGIHQAKSLQQQRSVDMNQKEFELIKNIKDYDAIRFKLQKNGKVMQYKQFLKTKIMEYLSAMHSILKKQERKLYGYIQNMTISTPYIIFDGLKKMKQDKQNKSNHYLLSKPNQERLAKQWNKIYADAKDISNEKKQNKKVKIDESFTRPIQRKTQTPRGNSLYENQKIKNLNQTQNLKSAPMKKPFNFDTVNIRYDKNRQDRLQQKFRNLLVRDHSQP